MTSGILLLGLEIMILPAVALMGKENFTRIVSLVKGVFKSLKPAGNVGRTRYTIGLVLLVLPILFAWITSYIPSWRWAAEVRYPFRHQFVAGPDHRNQLVRIGGDFWDKLRAIFQYDARVVFTNHTPAEVAKTLSA